jgi:hypothetical protein
MPTCVFKTDDVRRCIEHALNSTEWRMGWSEEPPAPALFFVHDQGVYLMSNGEPRDLIPIEGADTGQPTTYCAYAEHCDPSKDEDWWENASGLVGGDDFAETISVNRAFLNDCGRYEQLEVELTPTQLSVYFSKPRRVVQVS